MRILFALPIAIGASIAMAPAASAQGADSAACGALTALRIPEVRIVRARAITPAPVWTAPPVNEGEPGRVEVKRAFCRVEGTIEDEIGFELWLPTGSGWNGRLLGVGNGGFAGFIRYDGLARGANLGFASVSTDTGHKTSEANWSIGKPRRLENYGFRAQHLTAVNAKAIVRAFYGAASHHNYFVGCSGGGLQAMNLVQRYPADYDGIIAGSHGRSIVGISARWLSGALIARNDPPAFVTADGWRTAAETARRQCDAKDGVRDGIITEPGKCRFDFARVPGFTPAQVQTARLLYGPILGKNGETLYPGFQPGVAFSPISDPGPAGEVFAQWLHGDPAWDVNGFDAARDIPLAEDAVAGASATNPNLTAFMRRGGKLISQNGLTDPIVPAQATIDYYDSVTRFMGQQSVDSFYKLYLPAGVDHCEGGTGADNFGTIFAQEPPVSDAAHDMLAAMVDWVERGRAPGEIIASKIVDGKVKMTRPICPYPLVPRYKGRGDSNDAASFQCAKSAS